MEWPDYYADSSCHDLKRFFDCFLKKDLNNGWLATPKVRLAILNFGLSGLDDTVNRAENEFPLARTEYRKLYLTPDQAMSRSPSAKQGQVTYDSKNGNAKFQYRIPDDMETTGYFIARLAVSASSDNDMDLFVHVSCLRGRSSSKQGVLTIRPDNAMLLKMLKLMHDWQVGLRGVGMLFRWGPSGQLRVSHGQERSELSTTFEPLYRHTERVTLTPSEIRVVDIPLRPYGMYWKVRTNLQRLDFAALK